ncbi:hypothetical protein CC79DRAFT_1110798 [Sarocladium strictum]
MTRWPEQAVVWKLLLVGVASSSVTPGPARRREPKSHRPRLRFQVSFRVQWPSSVRTAQSGQELRSGQLLPHSADGERREVESKSSVNRSGPAVKEMFERKTLKTGLTRYAGR